MNKTTNQYINQLNLDPKRETAVRKLVEGAGGVSDSTPLVENLAGNELIPIKQDGENKAVRADELIKGGKEIFIITSDMFEQTATTIEIQATLTFTDDGWADFIDAVEANKIIALDFKVGGLLLNTASPMGIRPTGFIVFNSLISFGASGFQGFISFPSQGFESPAIYVIIFKNKNVYNSVLNTPSEVYYLDVNNYSTAEDFTQLQTAINNGNVIIVNNLPVMPFNNATVYNVYNVSDTSITLMCVSSRPGLTNGTETNITYDTILITFTSTGGKSHDTCSIAFDKIGDGTKFLANDGSYKEVSTPKLFKLNTIYDNLFYDLKSCITNEKLIYIAYDDMTVMPASAMYNSMDSQIYLRWIKASQIGYRICEFTVYTGTTRITESVNEFTLLNTGDGTKYLSNDGSYKEMSGNIYIFNYKNSLTSDEYDEIVSAYNNNKTVIISKDEYDLYGYGYVDFTARYIANNFYFQNDTYYITYYERDTIYAKLAISNIADEDGNYIVTFNRIAQLNDIFKLDLDSEITTDIYNQLSLYCGTENNSEYSKTRSKSLLILTNTPIDKVVDESYPNKQVSIPANIYISGTQCYINYNYDNYVVNIHIYLADSNGNPSNVGTITVNKTITKLNLAPYIWGGTTSEVIFNELKEAIEGNRRITYNNLDCKAKISSFGYINLEVEESIYYEDSTFEGYYIVEYNIYSDFIEKRLINPKFLIEYNSNILYQAQYYKGNVLKNTSFTFGVEDYARPANGKISEYQGEFSFGDTVYTVTFPDTVKWSTDSVLEYKANYTYQFRIVNGLGVMKEFANS